MLSVELHPLVGGNSWLGELSQPMKITIQSSGKKARVYSVSVTPGETVAINCLYRITNLNPL